MKPIKNIAGQKFGRLVPIKLSEKKLYGRTTWVCLCDCGKETSVTQNSLTRRNTSSCGCFHKETSAINGKKNTKENSGVGRLYNVYKSNAAKRNFSFTL